MVDAIPRADGNALFTEAEQAAIAMAIELTRTATLADATFARVAKHFTERQLLELVVNVGVANLNNRLTDAFTADVEEAE